MIRRRERRVAATDAAPDVVLRLAVLLQAGVSPPRAWRYLAESGDTAAAAIVAAVDEGAELPDAIAARGGAWAEVGAAWRVAETVGAPLADSLRGIAAALRDAGESADEVRVALAEPAGTARLMAWLPLVGIVLGLALGFDTFGMLTTHPAGIACLVAGALLILASRRWTRALVRRAQPAAGVAGLRSDLLAIALSGGVSLERAEGLVARALGSGLRAGASRDDRAASRAPAERDPAEGVSAAGDPVDDDRAEGGPAEDDESAAILRLSRTAGVPAVELLRAAAALARHRVRTEGRLRAARLSSALLIPLGVCTLPAFLVLGVAPMMLSVLSSTSLSI